MIKMKLDPIEQKICDKYSARDTRGYVHCFECPLTINDFEHELCCKANVTDEEWLAFANDPFPWTEGEENVD